MAGWLGRKTAADVHVKIRTPERKNEFCTPRLAEDFLENILFLNDLSEEA
jgi:hypothetical protein